MVKKKEQKQKKKSVERGFGEMRRKMLESHKNKKRVRDNKNFLPIWEDGSGVNDCNP